MNIKLPPFKSVWATFERCGFQYSKGNVEKVAFGYRIAQDMVDHMAPPDADWPLKWVPDEPVATHRVHELKTDRDVFDAVWHGYKTCEIRYNDRDFERGDTLDLRETQWTGAQMRAGAPLIYTGRRLTKRVSHVLSGYGLQDGWVILSFNDFPKFGDIEAQS